VGSLLSLLKSSSGDAELSLACSLFPDVKLKLKEEFVRSNKLYFNVRIKSIEV